MDIDQKALRRLKEAVFYILGESLCSGKRQHQEDRFTVHISSFFPNTAVKGLIID